MTIQLALFFIVAAAGLWVDQLYHGSVAHLSSHRKIYEGGVIAVICVRPFFSSHGGSYILPASHSCFPLG